MHHTALPHRCTAPSTELCCAAASLGFARAARGTAVPTLYIATLSRCFTLPSRWSASPWPRKSTPRPRTAPLRQAVATSRYAKPVLCEALPVRIAASPSVAVAPHPLHRQAMPIRRAALLCLHNAALCLSDDLLRRGMARVCITSATPRRASPWPSVRCCADAMLSVALLRLHGA